MTERRRRRAVGPVGAAVAGEEPVGDLLSPDGSSADTGEHDRADEERLRRERPPHHDQER